MRRVPWPLWLSANRGARAAMPETVAAIGADRAERVERRAVSARTDAFLSRVVRVGQQLLAGGRREELIAAHARTSAPSSTLPDS